MFATRHFVTGNFVSRATFVSDETYSVILDNVVKATCDIFLTRKREGSSCLAPSNNDGAIAVADSDDDVDILLGYRIGLPHADWWIPGGRMIPGETTATAARRILRRELKLDLGENPETRISTVAHFTFAWDSRTQPPVENGTCDVSIILRVDLTSAEAGALQLVSGEYRELQWRSLSSQRDLPAGVLHPALTQGIKELCAMRQWQRCVPLLSVADPDKLSSEELRAAFDAVRAFGRLKGEL